MLLLLWSLAVGYISSVTIYRLYLSPVSSFSGPKLAALTFWYEFYCDVILKGRYTWKIQELHQKYGPIIRINPEELHVNDPAFYDQVYVGAPRKTDKWPWSAKMFGTSMAAVGTVDHDLHRMRRGALNPFFSKKSITELEPIIQNQIDKLCTRLGDLRTTDKIVNLSDALTCLSADVISDCAFGEAYGLLESPDFAPEWRHFMMDLSLGTHLMKQFGWAYQLVMATVPWLPSLVHPLSKKLEVLRQNLTHQIEAIRTQRQTTKLRSHRTFFHSLLDGDLPDVQKSTARLTDEALTIIGAGTVTTAHTLSVTLFNILSNPTIKARLQKELACLCTGNSRPSWNDLARLPYLSAVITEGLRLSFGVSHRLQRISPDLPLQYHSTTIPPGTPVSLTQMFIMTDPELFPKPHDFIPERWMQDELPVGFPSVSDAKKFFIPFSRGSRSCVGMNLAYAELFLTIGTILRPAEIGDDFDLVLFETTKRDFEVAYDWFNPCPALESKGLRVLVHKRSNYSPAATKRLDHSILKGHVL